jgi:hypothetical protein
MARSQSPEVPKHVDWETGRLVSCWDVPECHHPDEPVFHDVPSARAAYEAYMAGELLPPPVSRLDYALSIDGSTAENDDQ